MRSSKCRTPFPIPANSPQNKAKSRNLLQDFNGADGRIRTGDLILTKDALYLLSYISAVRISSNASVIILQPEEKSNTLAAKLPFCRYFLQFQMNDRGRNIPIFLIGSIYGPPSGRDIGRVY